MNDGKPFEAKLIAADYLRELDRLLDQVDLEALARVVDRLRAVRDRGGTIYLAGNGGSAATAAHWANDLGKATRVSGRALMRVMSMTDNVPWLTALANDEGYERVFAGQLENFARPDDALVVLSASGNSPNLLEAVELASERGVVTIALVGFDGGALKERVDEHLWLRSEQGAYGIVETGHAVLCDILTTCLMKDLAVPAGDPAGAPSIGAPRS
jgi:D-sedoheptulose 7-phosphate isomerase